MAVIEYKMLKNAFGRREVPGYVDDRGHWYRDSDGTYVGWLSDEVSNKFYVDTANATTLTKSEFVARGTAAGFLTKPADWDSDAMGAWTQPDLETWYDEFVTNNS